MQTAGEFFPIQYLPNAWASKPTAILVFSQSFLCRKGREAHPTEEAMAEALVTAVDACSDAGKESPIAFAELEKIEEHVDIEY